MADTQWEVRLKEASTALSALLNVHASEMASWTSGDEELQSLNTALRRAVQEYENVLSERTGALLDLGRIEDADDRAEMIDEDTHEQFQARQVSVISRYEYTLGPHEEIGKFSTRGRNYTTGLQVTFIATQRIPVDDPMAWPPDDFNDWLRVDGVILKEEIFDPLLDES